MAAPGTDGSGGPPGMERRLLLAILLAVGILIIWQMLFPPPPRQVQPAAEVATSDTFAPSVKERAAGEAGAAAAALEAGREDATGVTGPAVGEEQVRTLTIETDVALVMISNLGGRVQSWKLTQYKDDDGRNLELIPDTARDTDMLPLGLQLDDPSFTDLANKGLFQLVKRTAGDFPEIEMTWADGAGREVRKTLSLGPGYEAEVTVEARHHGVPQTARLVWGPGFGENRAEAKASFGYHGRGLISEDPRPRRIEPNSLDAGEIISITSPRSWAGMEDTYFTALFLPEDKALFSLRSVEIPAAGEKSEMAVTVLMELPPGAPETRIYIGPKDYKRLEAKGRNLQEVVHFQSGIPLLGPLVTLLTRGLFHALVFLHTSVVANWGWAIVILTMVIKLVFWPVTQKSMLSMKRIQEKTKRVQPKVAAIKDRYRRQGKKDIESRSKMNQEVMELYKKENINPMGNLGGCLPLLLQLPILYGFYNLLQVAIELRQAPFMFWIHDLSRMDPYYVLPIVMGASMVGQQVLTGAAIADPMQRRMMYMTPVLFTLFFINLPTGLVLYWLVNNLLGIVQQSMINRRYALETALPAGAPAARKA